MTVEASCLRYRESIPAWVDGELTDPAELEAVETHVRGCESCRTYAEAEVATKTLLAKAYVRPVEIGALRARVRESLDTVTGPPPRRWPVWMPRLAWGGLVAVLLATLALGYLTLRPRTAVEASPLVRAAVTDHVQCMLGRLPLELTTTQQDEVSRWLQGRLGRPIGLPALSPEGEARMSTRWARLARAEGAQVLFDRAGRMLSLFIMPVREVSGELGRRVTRADREFFLNRIEGYTVVFWRRGDLLYCLVADGPEDEVLGFAAEYAS